MKVLLILSVLLTSLTALQANATDSELFYRCSEDVLPRRDESGLAVSIYREKTDGKMYAYIEELYATETQCWPTDPGGRRPSPMDCEYEVLSSYIASFEITSSHTPNEVIFGSNGEKFGLKVHNPIPNGLIGILNLNGSSVKVYCAKFK